jgi:hypothetical protein
VIKEIIWHPLLSIGSNVILMEHPKAIRVFPHVVVFSGIM